MFQCQLCNTITPPRTPSYRLVVETRTVEHPKRQYAQRLTGKKRNGQPRKHSQHCDRGECRCWDQGGKGEQIVRELLACPDCAARFQTRQGLPNPIALAPPSALP